MSPEQLCKGLPLFDARYHSQVDARYGGHDPRVYTLGETAQILWLKGRPIQAREVMARAQDRADELKRSDTSAHIMSINLLLLRYSGEASIAAVQARELLRLARDNHFSEFHAKAEVFLGWAILKEGQYEAGIKLIKEGIGAHMGVETYEQSAVWLEMLAEAYLDTGNIEAGLNSIRDAFQRTRESGLRHWLAELHRRRGQLYSALGTEFASVAVENYEQAVAISREQGSRIFELRALTSWAHLVGERDSQNVRSQLIFALDNLPERHDSPDVLNAKAALRRLKQRVWVPRQN